MTDTSKQARAARFRAFRVELGIEQEEMATRLTALASSVGLNRRYKANDISYRETGRKALDAEDYALIALLDPQKRSWHLLAFGGELSVAKRGTKVADLASASTHSKRTG